MRGSDNQMEFYLKWNRKFETELTKKTKN